MKNSYDVIVVGAGTAGSYFAKKMAQAGYSVLVIDAHSNEMLGQRLDIFHIDEDYFEKHGVPKPKEGDADYVSKFDKVYSHSAFGNYPKITDYPFIVMKLPLFLQRLKSWAEESGVEYSLQTKFLDLVYEDNKIAGIKAEVQGKTKIIKSRLVADCSGIQATVRTKLLPHTLVETFDIDSTEKFYVVLRYVKLKNPEKDRVTRTDNYPYYKTWIAPQTDPNGAIIGVGANLSYEYAEKCFQKFASVITLPEYELEKIEKGTTPYRRPPFSFVGDGFVTLGDSACITKPFSGEGITAAWNLCAIAAQVASEAMKGGAYPTRELLWQVNVKYNRSQGADFANLLATLTGAVDATAEENDYEFKKDIVFASKDMTKMNREFAAKLSLSDMLSLGVKVLIGVISGKIRLKTVKSLLKAVSVAGALEKHYKAYPEQPQEFDAWQERALALWEKAGSMADNIIKMEEEQA